VAAEVGNAAHVYRADLSLDEDLDRLRVALQRDVSHIDLLVHSAGVHAMGSFSTSCVDTLDWQYRVNVRAPYVLTQALLPRLIERRGQVVFINSSAGLAAKANVGQYAATKHALKALADSLRDEVNAAGVRVLSVYPGRTASTMQKAIFKLEGREYVPERLMQPEDVAEVVLAALLLPATAEVTDINVRPLAKA
jgi:short-subunit dehydrogenase